MNKYFVYVIFAILFLLFGCKEKDIIITNDYVINPNWNEKSNLIEITKMKYKNDYDSIDLKRAKLDLMCDNNDFLKVFEKFKNLRPITSVVKAYAQFFDPNSTNHFAAFQIKITLQNGFRKVFFFQNGLE